MSNQKEKNITDFPDLIQYESSKKINEQMEKYIAKIKVDKEQATGFFTKIPFPDKSKLLPVFITNNHIINEEILNSNKKIEIDIKEEKDIIYLNLNNRIKYTNKEYDITIIEIKEKNIKYYLELDDIILNGINGNIKNKEYIDKTIYILQYPKSQLSVSYGIISSIYECENSKFNFNHKCSTDKGSSGGPVLASLNNKVLGIHKEGNKNSNYNTGTFLNYPIKEFIEKYYLKKNDSSKSANHYTILPNTGNIFHSEMLQNLTRNIFFKKELLSTKNSSNIFSGFLIKNQVIENLKNIYNTKQIISFLYTNNILKGVNYQNLNSNYSRINAYLTISQPNYLKAIEQIENNNKIIFMKKDFSFSNKTIKNIEYIENYEIIDEEFAKFLSKKFINNICIIPTNFIINENKFIFSYNLQKNNIYKISSSDEKGIFNNECIISISNKNNSISNKSIFEIILKNGIEKLISLKLTKINNIELEFYSIKEESNKNISINKEQAEKILKEELQKKQPNLNISIGLYNTKDIFHWIATISPPNDSLYKEGLFTLDIYFPNDYPNNPPEICFRTPIYHLNVNPNKSNEKLGHVFLSSLKMWNPIYKIEKILDDIYSLFSKANIDNCYRNDILKEFMLNNNLYNEKIIYFTNKYANPNFSIIDKKYDQNWDFSYNN